MAYKADMTAAEYDSDMASARREGEQKGATDKAALTTERDALTLERSTLKALADNLAAEKETLTGQVTALTGERDTAARRAVALETLVGQGSLTVAQAKMVATHPDYAGVDFANAEQVTKLLGDVKAIFPVPSATTAAPAQPGVSPLGGTGGNPSPAGGAVLTMEEQGKLPLAEYAKYQGLKLSGGT